MALLVFFRQQIVLAKESPWNLETHDLDLKELSSENEVGGPLSRGIFISAGSKKA